jgi:regulator of cell morphogenesis and NO signaling
MYLANSHDYYINEKIPHLQLLFMQLLEVTSHPARQQLKQFFEDYMKEVIEHIEYEEQIVFPYIQDLMLSGRSQGKAPKGYTIHDLEQRHSNIEEKLSDLKNLLIKYFPTANDRYQRIRALNELFDLEQDLINHARLEDKVLIPLVESYEQQNSAN